MGLKRLSQQTMSSALMTRPPATPAETPRPDDEAGLIQRAIAGDDDAFRELVERYGARVYAVAARLVGPGAEAEDVVQDVFFKVSRKLATFREEAAFSTWIYRVTVNTATDRMKRRRADRVALVEDWDRLALEDAADRPEDAIDRRDLRARVRRAMDRLPAIFRTILVLRELEGLSYEEIAAVLGLSKGTVESRIFRARAKVKALLEKDELGPVAPEKDDP